MMTFLPRGGQFPVKCVFCAEEIQDAAVVCRFCGAVEVDGRWQMRAAVGSRRAPAGTFTLRFAGAMFGLSAFFELLSISAAVPLFGELRGGVVAALYHGVYVLLFAGLFVGLWQTRLWAYPLLLAGTCFYTVDNLRYVLDEAGRKAQLDQQLTGYGGLRGMIDDAAMGRTLAIAALLFVACWWGFVLYVRRRRGVLTA